MATAVEVMKNFFNVLKDFSNENDNYVGERALDKAVRAVLRHVNDFKFSVEAFQAFLTADNLEGYSELDSDTRLQKVTGMVIGADNDYEADTGAITGSNAGGAVKKNSADIVPESGDLSTATLPAEGSTTQITYTGDDGKSFTFNVKWPESFSKFVSGTAVDSTTDPNDRMKDSRFLVDLNDFDENEEFYADDSLSSLFVGNVTYGEMKSAETTIIKALNTYWLQAGAKLIYDSYGLDFDGKTIEIQLIAGGNFSDSHFTTARNKDSLPADNVIIGLNLAGYGKIDATNPNGVSMLGTHTKRFLDRTVAHEMVHAAMLASGTLKLSGMPHFFVEGVADLVQGDDDYNSARTTQIRNFLANPDSLTNALAYEGTSSDAYPAGHMWLRFLAKNAEDTNIFVGTDENKNQTINFNDTHTIITNYDESNIINYDTNFIAAGISETFNDFIAVSSNATDGNVSELLIRDVRGTTITFTNPAGATAYVYMASDAGEIDGKTFGDGNKFEVLFGMNNKNNVIRAGNGGSQLWG
ncbi:MAG: hypothetical protein IJS81_07835, partial [Selenomonadaceae bacterium]|nr:hypothetical protein [Selenomonadaceae bacterium]